MMRRTLAIVAALAMCLTGCVGDDGMVLYAEFDDALDLVTQASVRAGDVVIGTITDIELTEDERARVTMEIDPDIVLPTETAAWLSKTSLLGERFVDLRPIGNTGQLASGTTLTQTRIITDFEDVVGTGSDVLAELAVERLAGAVRAGAEALGGRGSLLGQVIDDVRAFVGRYEDGTDTITALIDELALLTASLAPDAEANAADLQLLREVTDALDEQDEQLFVALADLQRLSIVGERIMESHEGEIDDTVRRLRIVLEEVNRFEGALDAVLFHLPRHNTNTPDGYNEKELTQVWLDFVICGMQDEQGNPADDCTPDRPNEEAPPPERNPCPYDYIRCPQEVE